MKAEQGYSAEKMTLYKGELNLRSVQSTPTAILKLHRLVGAAGSDGIIETVVEKRSHELDQQIAFE
jgi:hypothetical protein